MAHVTLGIPALPLRTPLHAVDLSSNDKNSSTGLIMGPDASLVLGDGDKSEQGDSWETESFFEDAFENLENEQELEDRDLELRANDQIQRLSHVPGDACSLAESLGYRNRLRFLGEEAFINETIEAGTISAKKLCTAFGIRPPSFLEGAPDHAYYQLLSLGVQRELAKRAKLPQYNTVSDVVALLKKSKRIVVVSGAGISTSLGIPDFRSKNTGLYSQLQHIGLNDPQEVFDLSLFRENPEIFYSVAKNILPLSNKFSPTHAFIRLLQDKQKLLTNFTQNIDNLEHYAGIHADKLVQCHGSFATASCIECKHQVKGEDIHKCLKAGMVAPCNQCISRVRQNSKAGTKRKRSLTVRPNKKRRRDYEDESESEDDSIAVAGVMKPDITFFGEPLPARFHSRLEDHDYDVVDLVLVIGTSLKVAPVSDIPGFLPPHVPQVYISRETCAHINFDITLLGDCDTIVAELCRQAGWNLDHEMVSEEQTVEINVLDDNESNHVFKP